MRYDRLGRGYAAHRRPDPRIAAQIHDALGDAQRVLSVGAGTGSYEPEDRHVVALEPSSVMIAQRAPGCTPVVRGVAEALPFCDGAFDAALAVFTVHHWADARRGLREVRRAARRQVALTWDGELHDFWLTRDYLPEALMVTEALESLPTVMDALGPAHVEPVPVPNDCADGFFGAYWARPDAYLDAGVRAAISVFSMLDADVVERAMSRLADDVVSGRWDASHGELRDLDELDLGYRLIIAEQDA